jgi:hypothetical protein
MDHDHLKYEKTMFTEAEKVLATTEENIVLKLWIRSKIETINKSLLKKGTAKNARRRRVSDCS